MNPPGPGFKKKSFVFRTVTRESTLPPHSDGAVRRGNNLQRRIPCKLRELGGKSFSKTGPERFRLRVSSHNTERQNRHLFRTWHGTWVQQFLELLPHGRDKRCRSQKCRRESYGPSRSPLASWYWRMPENPRPRLTKRELQSVQVNRDVSRSRVPLGWVLSNHLGNNTIEFRGRVRIQFMRRKRVMMQDSIARF